MINIQSFSFNPNKIYYNITLGSQGGIIQVLSNVHKTINNQFTINLIYFLKDYFLLIDNDEKEFQTEKKTNINLKTIDINKYQSFITFANLSINGMYEKFFKQYYSKLNDQQVKLLLQDSIIEILNNKNLYNKLKLTFKDGFNLEKFNLHGIDTIEEYNYFKNIIHNKNKIDYMNKSSQELFFIIFILLSLI